MVRRLSSVCMGVLVACYGASAFSTVLEQPSSPSGVKAKPTVIFSKVIAAPASASGASRGTLQPMVEMAGMTEYRLPNGLRIVLVPDASKPVTTVNVTYQVGSRHEHYGETGMAHLLEHLMFKGTPTVPHLTQELSSRGMRPNGTTWYDRTNYFETFAASDEKLEWALKMEADRMVNAFIARKDLDSEMTVVRNEMESGENDPEKILVQKVSSAAYQWHNYGKETIGARSDVEHVGIDRLKAFYQRYYQPDNAVLVVAGSFDQQKALSWIQRYFGAIPRPSRQLEVTYTEEPAQDGERTVHLQRVGSEQALAVLYHIPAATHPDFPAIEVLSEILTNTPSGRLYRSLVETKKATSVGASPYPLKEPGHLIVEAELREGSSLPEAQQLLLQGIESFVSTPVTNEELVRAKRVLTNGWNQTLRDPQKLGIALSQAIAMGDWRFFLMNQDRLSQVTIQDVERVARSYLQPANRTLGFFTPTKATTRVVIPQAEPIEKQLNTYQPLTKVVQGEVFNPTFEQIEHRVKRFQLDNGAKLAVLPKKNRGETVNVYAQLHWGDETSLKGSQWKGELLAPLLMRGTKQLTHQALMDELERLDVQLSMDSSVDGMTIRLETTRPNLEAAVHLLAELLKSPRFEPSEWEVLKQQTLAGLESSQTEPSTWASRQLERYQQPYSIDDPRYVSSLEEDLAQVKAIELHDVQAFYKDMFSTQYSEWAVVGEADPHAIQSQLNALLGDMKVRVPYQRLDLKVFQPKADVLLKSIPDKANALLEARYLMPLEDTDPDYPALLAANTLLGGGFLNSRLAMRVRQKEGISYGVGSYLKTSSDEPYTEWRMYALFAPQNKTRLLSVLREELEAMQKEPVDSVKLKEALQGWLESRRLARSQDNRLAVSLAEWMRLGRTAKDSEELENKVKALTPEVVGAAAKKYLQPTQWVYSIAGTFADEHSIDKTKVFMDRPVQK
jgi:zinc protease